MHLLTLIFGILLLPEAYPLKCNRCVSTRSGACQNTEKTCPSPGYQCASMRIFSYAGTLRVSDIQMRNCVVEEQCGESSISFGIGRHVITTKCCNTDLCNTQRAPEPRRSGHNGRTCCSEPACSKIMKCEGNEDHCITKIGNEKTTMGCASNQMCLSTVNAEIKGAIGGTFNCCQGNNCNSASSASAGLLLLVAPLVSLVMFS